MRDPYAVLGVGPYASRDDVRAAYRRLARRWHPDLHSQETRGYAENRMKELNAAYDAILTGRVTAAVRTSRTPQPRTAWDDFAHAFRDTVRADSTASWHTVAGPTVIESLRDIRDILLGRQSPPLTIDQVARRLRVSPRTVLRLVDRGILQASVIAGGAVRITTDALANYLLGREPRPARR